MSNYEMRCGEQYYPVNQYSMKCRIYPNKTQQKKIDMIIKGVHAFCNMVYYDVQTEKKYTTEAIDKETGETIHWLNIGEAKKKESLDLYRERNSLVKEIPATALSNMKKSCLDDVARQYTAIGNDNKIHNQTVERTEHTYYSKKKPRNSFCVQERLGKLSISDNRNVFYFNLMKVGKVKVRGWNKRIRFGDCAKYDFIDFALNNPSIKVYTTISKDKCSDYWIVFSFSYSAKKKKGSNTGFVTYVPKKKSTDSKVGIDCGIKHLATLSDGTKYENKKFGEQAENKKKYYSRKMSKSYGWSNVKFVADYKKDRSIVPSHNYMKWKKKNAQLSRDIARKRNDWQNVVTSEIVNNSSFIAVESLDVKGMMNRDRLLDKCGTRKKAAKYADRLKDAAMSYLLTKLKYKSEWYGRKLVEIGRYVPSSKQCSNCGYVSKYMGEEIREWTCPVCGTQHDRDINAAINILNYALQTNN